MLFDGSPCAGVELYVADIPDIGDTVNQRVTSLSRRSSTSSFVSYFADPSDGGIDAILELYDRSDYSRFPKLVSIEKLLAFEEFYIIPEFQKTILDEISKAIGGSGFLCVNPTATSFRDLDENAPGVEPFSKHHSNNPENACHLDAGIICGHNHFSMLFDTDMNSSMPSFARPFENGKNLSITNYPKTPMGGSKFLFGGEITGPRGLFVSTYSAGSTGP